MGKSEEKQIKIKNIARERIAESNIVAAKTLIGFSVICFAAWVLFRLEFLVSKGLFVDIALIASPILFLGTSILCIMRKGQGKAFQYIFLVLLAVFWLELELMSGYKSKMLLPILIVVSLRYYNRKFTVFTFFVCILVLFASLLCNAYLYVETDIIDLNTVRLDGQYNVLLDGFIYHEIIDLHPSPETLFDVGMRITFLPNAVMLAAITFLSMRFMRYNLLNMMKADELAAEEADARGELADMKSKVMLSQIRPHFIYNTLSSIAMLCTKNPEKAKKLVLNFSDYLRHNLDTLDESTPHTCTFTTELEHIRNYLEIELVRFEDKLKVEYDIEGTSFSVPILSVQPIVENAVKHGVCKKEDGGTVTIATRQTENGWKIIVSDDGVGFDPSAPQDDGKTHVGVENVKNRLALFGGELEIESKPDAGTTVTIFIPEEEGL